MKTPKLTPRETEILDLVKVGKRDREIGLELGITTQTVRNHVSQVLHRFRARTRTEVVIRSICRGSLRLAKPPPPEPRRYRRNRKDNQKYWARYYQQHRDEVLAKNRAWNDAHSERMREYRAKYRAKKQEQVVSAGN